MHTHGGSEHARLERVGLPTIARLQLLLALVRAAAFGIALYIATRSFLAALFGAIIGVTAGAVSDGLTRTKSVRAASAARVKQPSATNCGAARPGR